MAAATAPAIATTLSALLHRRTRRGHRLRATYARRVSSDASAEAAELESRRGGHGGTRLEEAVPAGEGRSRIDAWIVARLGGGGVSRSRVQASIRAGLVAVNGRPVSKVSHTVKGGDLVSCTVSELQPLRAEAEDIPLDIVYEDDHVLVVNKPAHMVVHPAPGNANGTLVNAILHHCRISTFTCLARSSTGDECPDSSDDDIDVLDVDQFTTDEVSSEVREALVRPGIVHRLDKGTSGLLVVAKDEHSHAQLAEQFKLHTIRRVYISLTCGVPNPNSGRIKASIARDPNNRIRMIAIAGSCHRYARHAASRYKVREVFAGGGSALVEWRLETGRTHQIRAHAKYLGIPLLGDETYGGTKSMALSLLRPRTPSKYHRDLSNLVSKVDRPCLHAALLGFKHPHSGKILEFSCPPPDDLAEVLDELRRVTSTSDCQNGDGVVR
ncbi:RNA pseudouridine synthase 2, chloroplastic-like isoform X2 [Phragmites australis]|uniref:RNA pseudouridine synthase 2, chloroplastic-like isoform X2 n=1 Tax=Phragmites australis TaxID=29695 RepID=UPI002D76BEFD|nr:RNA pseudouridine synthase 2, chloroplastic-like isoform X2 [Phragmites australis]